MSLLMRNARVATRYSGGFVQSIDGVAGGREGGQPVDWFYYVNGVEAAKGAAATNVHPGDHIWWDRHDWSETDDVPAVVGSFPEPFLNGLEGKRLPVRVECADAGGEACRDRDRAACARRACRPASRRSAAAPAPSRRCASLVAPWSELRRRTRAARTRSRARARAASTRASRAGGAHAHAARRATGASTHARRRRRADRGHAQRRRSARVGGHRHRRSRGERSGAWLRRGHAARPLRPGARPGRGARAAAAAERAKAGAS